MPKFLMFKGLRHVIILNLFISSILFYVTNLNLEIFNFYSLLDCPPCYSLLEEAIDRSKDKLTEIARLMEEIKNHPETIEDLDFQRKLREAVRKVDSLMEDAKRAACKLDFISKINLLYLVLICQFVTSIS